MHSREKTTDIVSVNGKRFRKFLPEAKLSARVAQLGSEISADFPEKLLLIGVLKGSYMFMADLARAISSPTQVDFVKISSYGDRLKSSEVLNYHLDLSSDIKDRDVLIVEDIVDSGRTISNLLANLRSRGPRSISLVALLHKPEATVTKIKIDYLGFSIPNKFVVGYGLDFAEYGRELRDIYSLDEPDS
jgi:hypoxanthine phosphoribosyltransferase